MVKPSSMSETSASAPPGPIWLNLVAPDEAEIARVEQATGTSLPRPDDLRQIKPSSRLMFENGALRLVAPMIVLEETDHPDLIRVGFVLTRERLITVRYKAPEVFHGPTGDELPADAQALTSTAAFVCLLQGFAARQADLLEAARGRLNTMSHGVFRVHASRGARAKRSNAAMREKMNELGRLGERATMVRDSLLAMQRMIPFALDVAGDWFTDQEKAQLQTVRGDIEALTLFEEHLLEKQQFLLDAILGFINIEQNDIFKVLTIASVVGIFPTLVAGWYGMNFHNMPEYGWAYGYQFGIGTIVVSTVIPLLWFKWRGWL